MTFDLRSSVRMAATKMNKTEARFETDVLRLSQLAGELVWYRYEPLKFRLGANLHYTPDFVGVDNTGQVIVWEVKGFWRDDARVKIKAAATAFPWIRFRAVQLKKKAWVTEEIQTHV